MGSLGITWHGIIWDHLGLFIWDHLGSSRIIWDHLGAWGIILNDLGLSSGIIWAQLRSSGIILDHVGSSGIIWAHLRSSGLGWDLWVHLGSSGIIYGAKARKSSNRCSWTSFCTPVHTKWPAVGEGLEVSGKPEYTKYCACASTIAQRTGNAQLTKTPQVHEAMRLCIQNDPRG